MDIEQLEGLAFGIDRNAALAALLPGTVEHDYWRGVSLQHAGQLDEVDAIASTWVARHGQRHELLARLERRQLLLRARADLPSNADALRREAGVTLDDRAEVVARADRFPTRLDPKLIDGDTLVREELRRRPGLDTVTRWALPDVVRMRSDRPADPTRTRSLLQRLEHANLPGIVEMIVADLDDKTSAGFGSVTVHGQLTLAQLEELAAQRPALRTQSAWVDAVLTRLQPPSFIDLRTDRAAHVALLERLQAFAETLAPTFNTLKAQILYHRLVLDRAIGLYDRARFRAYLELPRSAPYVSRRWLVGVPPEHLVRLSVPAAHAARLEPITNDEALVRDYLARFLVEEDGTAFADRLRAEWLEEVLATTRLLAGAPDPDRWAKILGAARLAALKDRVDIDLAPENAVTFRAEDDVALEVDLKNVRELEVKVFRINTLAYFLARNADVDTGLDLDGMVPSGEERTLRFERAPMQRARERIELPECKRPGTYVVELVGNGRSSRALLRKGSLRHVVRTSAAGSVVTIMDERGEPLADARVWLGGRELVRHGSAPGVVIPFSTRPGPVPLLLIDGDIVQRVVISHPAEHVNLRAGMHLERESLVASQSARILCRPTLTIGGEQASLSLVEDPRLDISITDLAGTSSSRSQPLVLRDDAEIAVDFNIPDGVTAVSVRLRGRVRQISTQDTLELDDGVDATLNGIHKSDHTETLHLSRVASATAGPPEYALHLLGKTGEVLAGRVVSIALVHRSVTVAVTAALETDAHGVIALGSLSGIASLATTLPSGVERAWQLDPVASALPSTVHALEGDAITVPAPEGAVADDLTLMEVRGRAPARDVGAHASIAARAIVIEGLPAGEYRLDCRGMSASVALVVMARRPMRSGWAAAGDAILELSPALPILRRLEADETDIVLELSGASPETRIHVLATRFVRDATLPSSLARPAVEPRVVHTTPAFSQYLSGRDIGDEYRYVLERRGVARRPGTMLEKPPLLLSPWALRSTTTALQAPSVGAAYAAMPPPAGARGSAARARPCMASGDATVTTDPGFPSVDFLARGAIVLDNQRPDASGVLRIPRAKLGTAQSVYVIVVDPTLTTHAELALSAQAPTPRDLRLRAALAPDRHYAEDRRVEGAPAGVSIVVPDTRTGKLEMIDTLARAHQLLLTLGDDEALRDFSFVTTWPTLDDATRRARYSKYACHELNLFLWRKDPTFFANVVRTFLAHKRDKTFLDRFLLGEDLSGYLEPWAFGRLNTLERILLAQAKPAVKESIARLIGDAVDLIPRDPEREAHLLASLLGATALDVSDDAFAPPAEMAFLAEAQAEEGESDDDDDDDTGASDTSRRDSAKKRKGGAEPHKARSRAQRSEMPAGAAASFGGGGAMDSLVADATERERGPGAFFRNADKTQEWAETSWWKRRVDETGPDVVTPNQLWRDLARGDGGPFLSPHIGECASSFTEAMCALAFLDLPFVAEPPERTSEDTQLTLTPRSHALVARTSIVEIGLDALPSDASVLIGQSYFRGDDRWEWDGAEQREKYVVGEMITSVVYRCQVVVTNPTSARQKLDVLLQIPRGAIPVDSGFLTRATSLQIAPYATHTLEYGFYFPLPGRFSHFPAHVSKGLEFQIAAAPRELEVVRAPTTVDPASWSYVSQHGSVDDVLALLDGANIGRIDLRRVAWRMHDRDAFTRISSKLEQRHVYDDRLWSYALSHHDARRTAEWLRHRDGFLRAGGPFTGGHGVNDETDGALDPIARGWYEHLEYAPLINARAHQLGARRRILNAALNEQYASFLELVAHRAAPTDDDTLAAAHYLLSMDRVDDAMTMLARVRPDAIATRLQYDYLAAYVACYRGDLAEARRLSAPWAAHPVDRWRHRFTVLLTMLDEAEGSAAPARPAIDPDSRDQRVAESAAREPALELTAAGADLVLQHHNLPTCQLRFYRMDIELVFSRQPFVQGDVDRFSFIEPGFVLEVPLGKDGRTVVSIPAALRGANLVVEAIGAGVRKSLAHYAHDLGVQVASAYGQLRVVRSSTQAALPATYVKIYSRERGGTIAFYKDGYTDLRGRFDYATLSTDDLDRVERFALLIASDEAGATIVETAPPPR